jgi:hypothetical protein
MENGEAFHLAELGEVRLTSFLKNASKRMRARAGSCALTEQALGATWY